MIRQVTSLAALAGVLLFGWAQFTLGSDTIAHRLLLLNTPQKAMDLANEGTRTALFGLIWQQLYAIKAYVIAGVIAGLVSRFAVHSWIKVVAVDPNEKVTVIDDAGGRYVMHGVPFAHAPYSQKWTIADVIEVPGIEKASLLETELLGAYKAGGHPADTMGYHGVSLFQHCLSVWQSAVKQSGPCSLESMLALAHDAGKMITFERTSDGNWVRLTPNHEMYNAEAIRRLPSFWKIPLAERELILLAIGYMAGGVSTKDVPMEIISAVQRVHVLDIKTTSKETTERRAGQIDTSQIVSAVIELSKTPPAEWNVNRSQSSSSPAGAIHISEGVLLVAGRALRTALAQRVDTATAAALSLHLPANDWHESYIEIANAVQKAGVGQRIVNNVSSESGWFTVRIGQAKIPHALALKTEASPATRGRWGINQLEIVLSEARK